MLPPPPHSNSKSSDENSTSLINIGNSFGFNARLGLLGNTTIPNVSYSNPLFGYTFSAALSLDYSYITNKNLGVLASIGYEFNNMVFIEGGKSNFITPTLYFIGSTNSVFGKRKMLYRIGIGYDIGIPENVVNGNTKITGMSHGIAIIGADEWIINKNNSIGLFAKISFIWINATTKDMQNNYSENVSQFGYFTSSIGISYRFHIGF